MSWSEIETYRQCPLKWRLAYDERWQAESTGTGALDKGSAFHTVMETHFKALLSTQSDPDATPDDRLAVAVQAAQERIDMMRMTNEYPEETIQLIEWMYVGYIEKYNIDETWRIMSVESTHIVPFHEPVGTVTGGEWREATDFNLKIKLDLIATDERDRLWIIDHKSGSTVPKGEKDFQFADQFKLYEYGMRYLGYRVCGTIHNACLSKPNKGDLIKPGDPQWKSSMKETDIDKRFHRTTMSSTDQELRMAQYEALCTVRKAYADTATERNPDEERCKWKCSYNDACNYGRRNGDDGLRTYLVDLGFSQQFGRH